MHKTYFDVNMVETLPGLQELYDSWTSIMSRDPRTNEYMPAEDAISLMLESSVLVQVAYDIDDPAKLMSLEDLAIRFAMEAPQRIMEEMDNMNA